MTPERVIELLQEPVNLLRACYLMIQGGATRTPTLPNAPLPPANGQAPVARFKVEIKDSPALWGLTGEPRAFVKIIKQPGVAVGNPAADEFDAYYIPMVQTSDVVDGTSHYALPTDNTALSFMMTSQLSACMFGTGSDANGAVLVSHVQPKKDPNTGTYLDRKHLVANVSSGFGELGGSVGKGQGYTEMAAVIGKRKGSSWSFYCQEQDVTRNRHATPTITSVSRFSKVK